MEEEFGEMCPQTQEFCNHHRPEAGQGKEDSPLEPQGSMAPHLNWRLPISGIGGSKLLLC